MNKFNVISKKFYNEYRNGSTFASFTSEFTERLQGNAGEKVKLVEEIEVATIVNESESIDITFNQGDELFISDLLDFNKEGLYTNADLIIEWNGNSVTATVEGVTNNGSYLKLDTTGVSNLVAAGLLDGETRDDIVIKVSTVPTTVTYKYGLIPNTNTSVDFSSPFDGEEQAYYLDGINTGLQDLIWLGDVQSSNLGSAQIKFDTTTDSYKHKFTIEHIFIIPVYISDYAQNITKGTNPSIYGRGRSVKYCNSFSFGDANRIQLAVFNDIGLNGNVGYLNENFAGRKSNYTINNLTITNTSGTGVIEQTETNAVSFEIENNASSWAAADQIIMYHLKMTKQDDYLGNKNSFEDVFVFEGVRQREGNPATSGTYIQNLLVSISGTTMTVTFNLDVTSVDSIDSTDQYLLYLTVASQGLGDVNAVDRINLTLDTRAYSKNKDVKGIVSGFQPKIFNHWDFASGTKYFTNFDGWDGDLLGVDFTFDTDVLKNTLLRSMNLLVVIDNGVDYYKLGEIPINFGQTQTVFNTYQYQVLNYQQDASFNIPNTDDLGFILLTASIPIIHTGYQTFRGKLGIRVPWRDWIENLNIPTSFVDYNEPNNNQNEQSSRYSGVSGYTIKLALECQFSSESTVNGQTVTNLTDVTMLSDGSTIYDFDDDGGTGFSAVFNIYDKNGDAVQDISSVNSDRIEVVFTHSLGTLTSTDLWGRIWIEKDGENGEVWELSTEKEFANPNNPLKPSDTLSTGNVDFVEIVSTLNEVKLICATNPSNLINSQDYNIYARLGSKL